MRGVVLPWSLEIHWVSCPVGGFGSIAELWRQQPLWKSLAHLSAWAQQRGKQDRKEEGRILHRFPISLLPTSLSSGSPWVGFREAGQIPEDSFWTIPVPALGDGQHRSGLCSGGEWSCLAAASLNLCMSVFSPGKSCLRLWVWCYISGHLFTRTMEVL